MTYRVFTTEFDEVIRPLDIMEHDELAHLSERFHQLCPVENLEPLKERIEKLTPPDESTVFTLLIDNSGSMRGSKISHAVGAAGIIATYLDKLGIPNEILGFTTKAWKGGDAREKWIDAGRPAKPGRLNALRHIIYKEASETLADSRLNLAAMFREGILKENIDGEAVEWACARLRQHDAKRRILLIISDGAPIDDSTIQAEGEWFLKEHLHEVIDRLSIDGDILVDAIGFGIDVSNLYENGTRIDKMEELCPVAIEKLEHLLTCKISSPRPSLEVEASEVIRNLSDSLELSVLARVQELFELSIDEKLPFNQASKYHLFLFLNKLKWNIRPSVFLVGNGNLRLLWLEERDLRQVGIQILPDGTLQCVLINKDWVSDELTWTCEVMSIHKFLNIINYFPHTSLVPLMLKY